MIRYPDYRLITLLDRFLRYMQANAEPPLKLIRPLVRSVDEALAWLAARRWPAADVSSDAKRRKAVKRLEFGRFLRDTERINDGR